MTNYINTVGRRKTATAQVKLFEGSNKSSINGRDLKDYVTRSDLFDVLFAPLKLCGVKDSYFLEARVEGSGVSAQIQALSLAIARALSQKDEKFKKVLKEAGLLTRDARIVERKKPGLHKARKASQWSKR